jgi:hypothetical protein
MNSNNILFFVKFGKKDHLERLLAGNIYFSNAGKFREIEEEQLKKGQGDKCDGMFNVLADKAVLTSNNQPDTSRELFNQLFNIDFGKNAMKAVFCITAGTKENCSYFKDERHYKIQFCEVQANTFREHFPKADSVLLIKRPLDFIENVYNNIGHACYCNKVLYYKKDHLTVEFCGFIFEEIKKTNTSKVNMRQYVVDECNVYRFLLCKDNFFKLQQEYRIVLYKTKINSPREFGVLPIIDGEIYTIDDFLSGVEVHI